MRASALFFICLSLTCFESKGGKLVGDLRWKPTETEKDIDNSKRVQFRIPVASKNIPLNQIVKFEKPNGKSKFLDWQIRITDKSVFLDQKLRFVFFYHGLGASTLNWSRFQKEVA